MNLSARPGEDQTRQTGALPLFAFPTTSSRALADQGANVGDCDERKGRSEEGVLI